MLKVLKKIWLKNKLKADNINDNGKHLLKFFFNKITNVDVKHIKYNNGNIKLILSPKMSITKEKNNC